MRREKSRRDGEAGCGVLRLAGVQGPDFPAKIKWDVFLIRTGVERGRRAVALRALRGEADDPDPAARRMQRRAEPHGRHRRIEHQVAIQHRTHQPIDGVEGAEPAADADGRPLRHGATRFREAGQVGPLVVGANVGRVIEVARQVSRVRLAGLRSLGAKLYWLQPRCLANDIEARGRAS